MKSIWIATAVLAAAIALTSCKNRRQEPVPGPRAEHAAAAAQTPSATAPGEASSGDQPDAAHQHGASGISWFQGTVEEAFSTTSSKCTAMLLHEALNP
jgi:hypothetical protein